MADITKFYPRRATGNVDAVLKLAKGQFSQVVVLGIDEYGVIGVCTSLGLSDEKVIYLMERFKHDLLSLSAGEAMTLPPLPDPLAAAVRVKPLEWTDRSRAWVYAVKPTYGQGSKPFMVTRGSVVIAWTDTDEEGRAAAQADHEVEILSFLEPIPAA